MQLRERPDVAVMELGMNHAGEISTLVAIAEPDVRVWTNVGDAHLGFFASPDAIADAKAEILERATPATVLVCNADDPRVMARARALCRAGRSPSASADGADVRAHRRRGPAASTACARASTTPAGERDDRDAAARPRQSVERACRDRRRARVRHPARRRSPTRAARLRPADRRGAVRRLRGGITLIDDSYNSSPSALAAALDVVARETRRAAEGRRARRDARARRALAARCTTTAAALAAAAGLSVLFAIGGAPARALAEAAIDAGMPRDAVTYFETSEQAAPRRRARVRAGDLVLVKGSRGIRTDIVADRIAAELA